MNSKLLSAFMAWYEHTIQANNEYVWLDIPLNIEIPLKSNFRD